MPEFNHQVELETGVLEEECRRLIKHFIIFNTQRRPYITLKWAESADGFIDINRTEGKPIVLSSPLTGMVVHKKRAEHDAILVGRRTALLDNPSLTTRNWYGKNPVRLVIDKDLTLSHCSMKKLRLTYSHKKSLSTPMPDSYA